MQESTVPVYEEFMGNGHNMFIATRLGRTEKQHAATYYNFMAPQSGSVIVDMGSGIGEHGAYFSAFDPTLVVINIVNDETLIEKMISLGRHCIHTSYTDTKLPDESVDIVMFNESLGYEPLADSFKEAFRILRPNGEVVIKDFSITDPKLSSFKLDKWGYSIRKDYDIIKAAEDNGLSFLMLFHPVFYMQHLDELSANNEHAKASNEQHPTSDLPLCTSLIKFKKGTLNGRAD